MSNHTTALLVQGPAESEDSRIALGILSDRGWSIERLSVPPTLLIPATPISMESSLKHLSEKLVEAEKANEELRRKMAKQQADSTVSAYGIAGFAAAIASAITVCAAQSGPGYGLVALTIIPAICFFFAWAVRWTANHKESK